MSSGTPRAKMIAHVLLLISILITVAPLIWMVGLSFKSNQEMYTHFLRPVPVEPTLNNYRYVIETYNIFRQGINSMIFSFGVTVGQVTISILAGFAFARYQFRGANLVFGLFIITLPIPFVVYYVPNYLLMSELGWLNTYQGMILPQVASAYGIFLLRQHFLAFPKEIMEAARVDGASDWRILWTIIVPTMRAAIAALSIFVFISTWNEYVWPFLISNRPDMHILTVGLASLSSGEAGRSWGAIMAAASLAAIPVIILYIAIRNQLLAMFVEGAVKG